MKTLNEDIYSSIYIDLRKRVIRTYLLGYFGVFLFEILFGIVRDILGLEPFTLTYFLKYCFLPTFIDGIIIGISIAAINDKTIKDATKNYILCGLAIIVCVVLAVVHSYFSVSILFFVIPIVMTSAFLDKKLTFFIGVASILFAIVPVFFAQYFVENFSRSQFMLNWLVASIFIGILILIVTLVVRVHEEREKVLEAMKETADTLKAKVSSDGLSGLLNHSSFYHDLQSAINDYKTLPDTFSVAMLDIDFFKTINDTYGHGVGDKVISCLSEVLKRVVGIDGTVYRYGGDEFGILFRNCTAEDSEDILREIRDEVAQLTIPEMDDEIITLSMGIYEVCSTGEDVSTVFANADKALYKAKRNGRNRIERF